MVALFPPQTVLTPAGAANELQARGLDALGLAAPALSPVWAGSNPAAGDLDEAALTLTLSAPRAPFRAVRSFAASPSVWSGVDGAPLSGPALVLALHPEAARRLERLAEARYGTPRVRPVPVAMLVRGFALPASVPAPAWFVAGETLDAPGGGSFTVSFHDARGLPIDPVAVAHMLRDLLSFLPGLRSLPTPGLSEASPGGLDAVAALATGLRCHVIDPHGWGYRPTRPEARLKVVDGTGAETAQVPDGGLATLAAGQSLGRSTADDAADQARPLRWGWALNGTLDRAPLAPPALPAGVALGRQFLRAMAVDLDWHLRGNRTAAPVQDIPGDDDSVPDFLLPAVRDPVPQFAWLADGMDLLGAAAQMTAGFPAAGASVFAIAVSPVLDPSVAAPPQPGPAGHWPAFPPPDTAADIPATADPRRSLVARFRAAADGAGADRDVVLTIPPGTLPDGVHVRAYPRRFVEIASIGEEPSFLRGDGGAVIASAAADTLILLENPFGLGPAEPRPDPARLTVDLVVTGRSGRRRLFSAVTVPVEAGPQSMPGGAPTMGGTSVLGAPGMAALLDSLGMRAICPVPLFGLPRPAPPAGGTPTSVLDLVRRLASEGQPRQGPRLPTQARFDTALVIGTNPAAGQPLAWQALVTGARWAPETRSARPELGDPGNPAGPDIHAAGVACAGRLAWDVARHAVRRAQPILPLGAGIPGWLVAMGGDNWNQPAADTAGSIAAVALETVAAICDTPELAAPGIPAPQPGDTIQGLVNSVANAMGVPPPTINVANGARLVSEVQREIVTAKSGRRDALWALRRALGQARELVYVESPMFARTARPGATPAAHEIDLVEVLRAQMAANPRLKIVICVPRLPDFAPDKGPWLRAALQHRKEAIETLTSQDRDRVAAFHPIGFPGRHAAIRSTVVIIDDVFCLTGTSHFRRRGMTFDGALDIAAIDRTLAEGYSAAIRTFRQQLMAAKLGVEAPTAPAGASALWVRLARPESAFDAVADLLAQGGLGRCSPVWAGPTDTNVIPQTADVADPDGANGAQFLTLFASLLSEA